MFLQKDKHHLRLYCGKIKHDASNGNAAYAGEKRRAAVDHRFDNIGYMRAKYGFVKAALADARRWYEVSEEKGP